jgi:hypothetical protein
MPHERELPACERRFADAERRLCDIEAQMRGSDGIYSTLKELEVKLAEMTGSLKTAVAAGTFVGAMIATGITLAFEYLLRK